MSRGYEQWLSGRVRDFADHHRDRFFAYKIAGGPYSLGGMPDWMFIGRVLGDDGERQTSALAGRVVFIELKAPGEVRKPRQVEVARVMQGHGVAVFVAETLDQVKRTLACQGLYANSEWSGKEAT